MKRSRNEPEDIRFLNVKIDNLSYDGMAAKIKSNVDKTGYVCLADVGLVVVASRDPELLAAVNGSLISVPDGTPLAWFGKLLGCRKIERVSGASLMHRLMAEPNGLAHFLLGDTEETIAQVIAKAKKNNRGIRISGYSPPFRETFTEEDMTEIFARISEKNPDIIWVSFGGGKQDKWMHKNIHRLERGVMIGVGAAFKYYIGKLKTPPEIIQYLGLQWFYRMLSDPKRWLHVSAGKRVKFLLHFPFEVMRGRLNKLS